jgi:hypothetical protein
MMMTKLNWKQLHAELSLLSYCKHFWSYIYNDDIIIVKFYFCEELVM